MGKFRCIHPKDIFVVAMKKNMLSSASNISNTLNKNTGIASGKLSITSIQQIKGEVMGVKGANINWAIRHFFKKIEERGEDCKDYLLFTFDCDQIPHKKYISAITYKFLSSINRYHKFFAIAVHTFNNNLWRLPALVRVLSTSLTLVVLHGWTILKKSKDTWSSYAVSLKTVKDVN